MSQVGIEFTSRVASQIADVRFKQQKTLVPRRVRCDGRKESMRFSSVALPLGLLAAMLASHRADAATALASVAVSATVVSSCQASPQAAVARASATITTTSAASAVAITCTLPTPYRVTARAAVASETSAADITRTTEWSDAVFPPAPRPETIVVTVSY